MYILMIQHYRIEKLTLITFRQSSYRYY